MKQKNKIQIKPAIENIHRATCIFDAFIKNDRPGDDGTLRSV